MDGERIETAGMFAWVADGIIHLRSKGVVSTTETVEETYAAIRHLLTDGPKPVLFDARAWPKPELAAWIPLIENVASVFTAGAILVGPETTSDVTAFSAVVNRLVMPFKVFTDEESALAFLRGEAEDG